MEEWEPSEHRATDKEREIERRMEGNSKRGGRKNRLVSAWVDSSMRGVGKMIEYSTTKDDYNQ
jgi:hypothetical protein